MERDPIVVLECEECGETRQVQASYIESGVVPVCFLCRSEMLKIRGMGSPEKPKTKVPKEKTA